jgi:3-deoxy-D-manno-octulosonate 8-phosphate phosphatase (KDO 8-P phosphatase)
MESNLDQITMLVFDVDGVLTDGRIILGEKEELKFFNIYDGMGISIAKKGGFKIGIITGRRSEAVLRRARELNIDYVIQGSKKKLDSLKEIMEIEKLGFQNICYVGDDIIDVPVFRKVGFSATVCNAPEYIKSEVSYVSQKSGGNGAVRDIIEYILQRKGVLNSLIDEMIEEWREEKISKQNF